MTFLTLAIAAGILVYQPAAPDATATNSLIAVVIAVISGVVINLVIRFRGDKVINGKVDGVADKVDTQQETIKKLQTTVDNLNAQITELNKDNEMLKGERNAAIEERGQLKKTADLNTAQFKSTTDELQRQIARLEELHVVTTAQLKDVTDKRTAEIEKALVVADKLATATEKQVIANETRVGLEHRIGVLENTVANNATIAEIVSGIKSGIQTIANNPPPIHMGASTPASTPPAEGSAQPIMPGDNVVIARPMDGAA